MQVQSFSKKQAGFTLIELVVVIVILGILAVTAIPRFTDMTKDARIAAVNGAYGAVQSAATIAHAQALVKGQTGATGSVTMEGESVNLVYGYPATASIGTALTSLNGFNVTAGGVISLMNGSTAITECNVTYAQPTAAGDAPSITTDVDGC